MKIRALSKIGRPSSVLPPPPRALRGVCSRTRSREAIFLKMKLIFCPGIIFSLALTASLDGRGRASLPFQQAVCLLIVSYFLGPAGRSVRKGEMAGFVVSFKDLLTST